MNFELILEEAIAKWNRGEIVWSAELGGLGPGYEQAIQVLLWDIISSWKGKTVIQDKTYSPEFSQHADQVTHKLDKIYGFSGAQVGAAWRTAAQFLHFGYPEMMTSLPEDRWIQVSRVTPRPPEVET